MRTSGYDIIGDIHGHGSELEALLQKLEYQIVDGAYRHQSRQALFLGDLIDRGSENKKVVETVRKMVQSGNAQCIMGNHEFNSIAYHTKNESGQWVREHSEKNIKQHSAFTIEYNAQNQADLDACLEFFKSLPLYLDLGEIRLIHACWHNEHIEKINAHLDDQRRLTDNAIQDGHKEGTVTFEASDVLLKGHEIQLQSGIEFTDKDDHVRTKMRTRWWINHPKNLGELSLMPEVMPMEHQELPVHPDDIIGYSESAPALFIGHYWKKGEPLPIAKNVACVDYSMGKGRESGGNLVAYRWDGEGVLSAEKFIKLFE